VSVLAEPDQDEANSHFFEGFFLGNILGHQNQIGGDGSKLGSCPSNIYQPGGSSHSRGKRSPQPQWYNPGGSSHYPGNNHYRPGGSHHKPNYNNGGGLNWNHQGYVPGGSSYYPGGHYGHHNNHHGGHHHRGKRSPEEAPWLRPGYNYGGGLNWNSGGLNWNYPGYVPGGSSYYPGGHYGHHNNHHGRPGGIFGGHYRGKRSPQLQWNGGGSSSSNSKPDYNNGGGIEWNNPQNNPGGSSHYPGNNHHNNGHPGGSSHNRGKRTPEDAPWLRPHNSNKPNYKNGVLDWNNSNYNGGLQWNNNNIGQDFSCYSDQQCPGRQKCCNRACTQPIYYK